jgi:hypothetical protein
VTGEGASDPESRLLASAGRVQELFAKATAEILARTKSALGLPRATREDLDALAAQINAEAARARRAMGELILRGRRQAGDEQSCRAITELLVGDGLSRAGAAACARRIHAGPNLADEDVDRVMGAYLRLLPEEVSVAGPAVGAEPERQREGRGLPALIRACLSRFEAETGRGPDAVREADYAEAFQRWMLAQQPRE